MGNRTLRNIISKDEQGTRGGPFPEYTEVQAYLSQSQKEKVALLAAKYELTEPQLECLLEEYSAKHDIGFRIRKNITGDEATPSSPAEDRIVNVNYEDSLNDLSYRYAIPRDRLAAILIDYKTMSVLDKGNVLDSFIAGSAKHPFLKFSIRELIGTVKTGK